MELEPCQNLIENFATNTREGQLFLKHNYHVWIL